MSLAAFISYSRLDLPLIQSKIIPKLNDWEIQYWWDVDGLPIGKNWRDFVEIVISQQCGAFLAIVSENFLRSIPCLAEAELAQKAEIPIFPLLIGVEPGDLPPGMREWNGYKLDNHNRLFCDLQSQLSLQSCLEFKPRATIHIFTEKDEVREKILTRREYFVGRISNDSPGIISILDSRVSRQHLIIKWSGETYCLIDLNSRFGTYRGCRLAKGKPTGGQKLIPEIPYPLGSVEIFAVSPSCFLIYERLEQTYQDPFATASL